MHPFLYEAGKIQVPMYGLMIVAAFTAAFAVVHGRARTIGVHPDRLIGVYLAAAAGGLLGSRILYVVAVAGVTDWKAWFAGGGFAYYGGVIGGALGVFVLAHYQKLPGWKLADLLAPALVLGLGIGRVGCFFAGCCHGGLAPTLVQPRGLLPPDHFLDGQIWISESFPYLTTEFHVGVGRLHDVPLYPTQLWSAVAGIGLFALLSVIWHRRSFDGQVAASMLLLEPVFRFFIEGFRADHRGVALQLPSVVADILPGFGQAGEDLNGVVGLTTSQTIGLGMILVGIGIVIARRGAGVAPETPIEEE